MTDLISIVDADDDLAELIDDAQRERARREALTRVRRLSPGEWDAANAIEPDLHHRGFEIIDGLLSRDVDVLGRRCVELLGPGDVLRPWRWDNTGSHVQAEVRWVVLEPTSMAVLDHGLVVRMAPWPQLGLQLFARGTRRAHALAVALAIAHHPPRGPGRCPPPVGDHRDQEQERMDDDAAGDGDDQQDDCECEKYAHLQIGLAYISPRRRARYRHRYRCRRLNADVVGSGVGRD